MSYATRDWINGYRNDPDYRYRNRVTRQTRKEPSNEGALALVAEKCRIDFPFLYAKVDAILLRGPRKVTGAKKESERAPIYRYKCKYCGLDVEKRTWPYRFKTRTPQFCNVSHARLFASRGPLNLDT